MSIIILRGGEEPEPFKMFDPFERKTPKPAVKIIVYGDSIAREELVGQKRKVRHATYVFQDGSTQRLRPFISESIEGAAREAIDSAPNECFQFAIVNSQDSEDPVATCFFFEDDWILSTTNDFETVLENVMKAKRPGAISSWLPQALSIPLLAWALYPENPYEYYIFLRFAICGVFGFLAFRTFKANAKAWPWVFGATALIYNPIVRIHLTREIWSFVNVATIALAIAAIVVLSRKSSRTTA